MTLALDATLAGTNNEKCTLSVTGASALGTSKYASNFSAGVDSWSGATDGAHSSPTVGAAFSLLNTGILYSDQYVKRTITGLTSGHNYRVQLVVACKAAALAYLQVNGMTAGDAEAIPAYDGTIATVRNVYYDFVATGTSHELRVRRADDGGDFQLVVWSVKVNEIPLTGLGVTIQRTDANGTHYVRLQDGQVPDDTGAMTADDEEFALLGTVTWTVRDSSGALASDSIVMGSTYNLPLVSSVGFPGQVVAVSRLDGYDEALAFGEAKTTLSVVGREDPLVLERGDFAWSLRAGTLTYWCEDYDDATTIRDLYRNGRVALLRQATHPGLDLYHVASAIRITPQTFTTDGWRFGVEVTYQEVDWPEGVLQGVYGWSYADVKANYLAYYNLPLAFATYADLKAGP